MARVFFISTVNGRSKKKKKRSLFCAALVAGTINKLEQSIFASSISMALRKDDNNKEMSRCHASFCMTCGLYYKNILTIVSDDHK
jgi:hypothetical protein